MNLIRGSRLDQKAWSWSSAQVLVLQCLHSLRRIRTRASC